jgi:hypothetical protein
MLGLLQPIGKDDGTVSESFTVVSTLSRGLHTLSPYVPLMNASKEKLREPPDDRSKSSLICPICSHTSSVDGDWESYRNNDAEIRSCPDCGAVVERRPSFDRSSSPEQQPSPGC